MEVIAEKDIEVVVDSAGEVNINSALEVDVVDNSELAVSVNRKEFNIVGDELYIPKRYEDAPQWLRDLIGTVTEQSYAQKITELNNLSTSLQQLIVELEVAKNTYTQSIISSNDIDERINTAITTLNSSLSSSDATIVDLISTKATPDEASAIALNTISSSINNGEIGALVGSVSSTLTTETEALANNIDLVHAEMLGGFESTADVIQTTQAYVGIDEAGASTGTGLSAYLEDSAGNIGGADSQVANAVYINNGVPTSKFEYTSNLNKNGVHYKSGFGLKTLTTGGDGSAANPYDSEFWINAAKFKFTNDNVTGQVAPFTIEANGVTPQITFNGKVSFTNVSDTQGSGTNLLYNSAPKIGNETKGWSIGWSNHGLSSSIGSGFDIWRPTGGASVYVAVPGSPGIGTVFDISNSKFPVIANTRYEASAYLSSHRCDSMVTLAWFDINGNYISESSGTTNSDASSGPLTNWSRSTMFATAPSNAATAQFYVRSAVTGNDPHCFVAYAYAGIASTNQTIPSNWSEGSSAGVSSGDVVAEINDGLTTTINGGRITTGSITASQIQANSISADRLLSSNGVSTVWNGGGLVSANFNGNSYGNIGSPTAGFRLSSNAAGTVTDPNIYGAYIQGSTIDVTDMKVRASGYPNNFGRISYAAKNITVFMPNYNSGYAVNRLCSREFGIVKVDCWARGYDDKVIISLQCTTDWTNWTTIRTHSSQVAGMTDKSHVTIVFSELLDNSWFSDNNFVGFRMIDAGSEQPNTHVFSDILVSIFNS